MSAKVLSLGHLQPQQTPQQPLSHGDQAKALLPSQHLLQYRAAPGLGATTQLQKDGEDPIPINLAILNTTLTALGLPVEEQPHLTAAWGLYQVIF